jgi:AbrB family looped-hinge helix DNA binding protein
MQVILNKNAIETQEFVVSIGQKGQITVPKSIRKQLNVKPKDKLLISYVDGGISVRPTHRTADEIYQMGGTLPQAISDREQSDIAWEEHAAEIAA